jgi:hypothetical protein
MPKKPHRPRSTYTTLHVSVAPRDDGVYACTTIERRWVNGARDSARIIDRAEVRPDPRPGSHDEALWLVGQYMQLLAARGVVTQLGRGEGRVAPPGAPGGGGGRS